MLYQEVIRQKRDGLALDDAQIAALVRGITDGSLGDAQLGALAMAILLRGLNVTERVALTCAMRDSGQILAWDRGPVVDKHSTGGIGDNLSLVLAPALAACGAVVPMISGRGLGHTGGTLDKLDAIPGYDTAPDLPRLRSVVNEAGCAIVGQTGDLAPADRRFYAIRDVTGTVESLDLICASILSKKLAAGLDALVLDVKCGSGAFMPDLPRARALAEALVIVANGAGCRTRALVTDMSQPLAPAAGNALEVAHAIAILRGDAADRRALDVTCALGGAALVLAGLAPDDRAGAAMIETVIADGRAAENFALMVRALGGPADLLDRAEAHLPRAPVIQPVPALAGGMLTRCNARQIGLAVIELGGGRRQQTDSIDPRVGFSAILPLGTPIAPGDPLALVHAATQDDADRAAATLQGAFSIGDKPDPVPLILTQI
jgi:thymidine phosphorylase